MRDRSIAIWLLSVYLLIFAMVLIGGTTRLTGSGLSMVEWHPLMGALPPMDQAAWEAVFAKYQESPQYSLVNHWMTLEDFKSIFFWEYCHRLLGRLIGVIFFLPWVYFVVRKRLQGRLARRTAWAFVFGGAQGFLGWIMVKSGLVDVPSVSHYRLAAHLMLALFVACWILWILFDLSAERRGSTPNPTRLRRLSWALVGLVALQCIYGAFMAGTRAGFLYDTFPSMNGALVPVGIMSMNPFSDPVSIHFIHRILAWLSAAAVLFFAWRTYTGESTRSQSVIALVLVAAVVLQFSLGVLTVILGMSIPVAVAHQGGGVLLLSVALANAHAWGKNQQV